MSHSLEPVVAGVAFFPPDSFPRTAPPSVACALYAPYEVVVSLVSKACGTA